MPPLPGTWEEKRDCPRDALKQVGALNATTKINHDFVLDFNFD
jgi:hypothetical protein